MLIPGKPVPRLEIETLAHGCFDLSRHGGENGTLLIVYRGLHCPICIRQMGELNQALDEFAELGIEVIMLSTDDAGRAAETAQKARVSGLRVGYGFSLKAARDDWGLWISSARDGSAEPELFVEPGHFYVGPGGSLYFGWVQSSPFARPALSDILGAIRFRLEKSYPPRGMYDGPLPE